MGTACILNARRCGRTHCRYTGAVLLGDDTFSACPGLRLNLREHLRLARTCPSYRLRCLGDLVDDRTPNGADTRTPDVRYANICLRCGDVRFWG
jgi:hypothetical protein